MPGYGGISLPETASKNDFVRAQLNSQSDDADSLPKLLGRESFSLL
jgi:hypothetical protein